MMQNKYVAESLLGREADITNLWQTLRSSSALMSGPRRIGKTSLLRQLTANPRPGWRALLIDLEGLASAEEGIERILKALKHAGLGGGAGEMVDQVSEVSVAGVSVGRERPTDASIWSRLDDALTRALEQLPEATRLALLLDEVPWWLDAIEQAGPPGGARQALAQLRYIRGALSGRLRVLFTGSVGLAGLVRSLNASATINDLEVLELDPLSPAYGAALFEMELLERGLNTTPTAGACAHRIAGGSPHWIKVLARRVQGASPVEPAQIEHAAEELISPRMRHLFADEGHEHLRRRHGARAASILKALLNEVARGDAPVPPHLLIAVALEASEGSWNRQRSEEMLLTLVDEFYLDRSPAGFHFVNPLLRRWWRVYGTNR